jgi:hypothetical protein
VDGRETATPNSKNCSARRAQFILPSCAPIRPLWESGRSEGDFVDFIKAFDAVASATIPPVKEAAAERQINEEELGTAKQIPV